MTIPANTSITLKIDESTHQAVVAPGPPTGAADEIAIWAPSGLNLELEKTQSIIGTLINLQKKALNRLSTFPLPEGIEDYISINGELGATDADIRVGGIPTLDDLRFQIGLDFVDKSQSHFMVTIAKMLNNRWLELSK